MGLESTIICIDNSEYMRNGDFLPTRLQAQQDAVGMVAQAKLRSNPESNVGLVALGSLEVLLTLTTDHGKALAKVHSVTPKGYINLISAVKIAHLALKHRIGKNHKTRIIAFVGSPITADEKEVIKMAKKLKKEKVSLDVVSFGEVDVNADLLKKLIEAVNGKDGTGSNLVTIPSGPHLTDALVSSPILQSEGGAAPTIPSSGGGFEFGVDPSEDPELAMALRISMEENRARQAAEDTGAAQPDTATTVAKNVHQPEDEAMLTQALAMSNAPETKQEPDLATMTEEEQIEYAMKMSMQTNDDVEDSVKEEKMDVDQPSDTMDKAKIKTEDEKKSEDYSEVVNDPQFLQSVLESLPGVDAQSDEVRQAMEALTGAVKKEEPKDDNSKKDE